MLSRGPWRYDLPILSRQAMSRASRARTTCSVIRSTRSSGGDDDGVLHEARSGREACGSIARIGGAGAVSGGAGRLARTISARGMGVASAAADVGRLVAAAGGCVASV